MDYVAYLSRLMYDRAVEAIAALPPYVHRSATLAELLAFVYPPGTLEAVRNAAAFFRSRAVLTTLNATVHEINKALLGRLPGHVAVYNATEAIEGADTSSSFSLAA